MGTKLYLINPQSDQPSYYGAEVFAAHGLGPTISIADLAITTVAGLAPADFDVTLCDESVTPVDFDIDADYVGITGKISQVRRMTDIANRFRQRGRRVIIGGSYASLSPDVVRPLCDTLLRGELEGIAPEFFADLKNRKAKREYEAARPDLTACTLPRWDLYPNDSALVGTVQTSRGCPFECDFCDVIQYLGRKQRHKSIELVLEELNCIYRLGYRQVFLADDNLTVHRARAKALLQALAEWNRRQVAGFVRFYTQVSIDAARDDEMLELCAAAGITGVFIGIETPNEASLRESKKRQNLNGDIREHVNRFLRHGIAVTGGMIVGFDADGGDIFERQYEFAMSSAIPIFTIGALVAPEATPLHSRLAAENRLLSNREETAGLPWDTNIVPKQMTREAMLTGIKALCWRLYEPASFAERVIRFIETIAKRPDQMQPQMSRMRAVSHRVTALVSRHRSRMLREEECLWSQIDDRLRRRPHAREAVTQMFMQYIQIRHMHEHGSVTEPVGVATSGDASRPLTFMR